MKTDAPNHRATPVVRQLLAIGLDEAQLESIEPLIGDACLVRKATFHDPQVQLERLVAEADVVLLAWGGPDRRAEAFLRKLVAPPDGPVVGSVNQPTGAARKATPGARIFIVTKTGEAVARLSPKEEASLSIAGWFHLPGRYFEVHRLLFDLDPSADEPDRDDVRAELTAPGFRKLVLWPERGPAPTAIVSIVAKFRDAEAAHDRAKDERRAGVPADPPLLDHVSFFHPDEAFASGIVQQLRECGVRSVTAFSEANEVFYRLRGRGTDALILWFDGDDTEVSVILDQLAEARDLASNPLLILVPGQAALGKLAHRHTGALFDAVAVYSRSRERLLASLKSMLLNAANPDTAKGLVTRLRRPFRPDAPVELRLNLTLPNARIMATRLGGMPGKTYWGQAELIPYLLMHRLPGEAAQVLEKIAAEQPASVTTIMLRQVITFVAKDKKAAADGLAKAALGLPEPTSERLFRIGSLLQRWHADDALADLVDGWHGHPSLPKDHQLLFLAAGYYRLLGKERSGGAFLAAALRQDPFRSEYLAALARHLTEVNQIDRALEAYRLLVKGTMVTVDDRVRLTGGLIATRRFKEAREQVALLLKAAPELKAALDMKAFLDDGPAET